jgi:Carboxypeptidase regulatory-like domain/TonB-dependent Receptor Plug Domain
VVSGRASVVADGKLRVSHRALTMESESILRKKKEDETMTKNYFRTALLCFVVCVCFSCGLAAQSIVTGGMSGTITDQTGAVITDATVTITNPDTGETHTITTSGSGDFTFALLKPGTYTMTITKSGFKTTTRPVTVILGQVVNASTALELGASSTTVEVTGESAAALQTENANISTTYETRQIQEVPNPGGDVTYIAQTAPGVTMNNSTGGGYGNFSTFGLPATSNLFTINGNDYNDPFLNLNNSGASNLLLGGNELQEVSVVNNAYTGQYGRQAGSQVDYTTKSGTNAFHGNLVYNWTGSYLSANDPVNKATSPAGGPINPRPFMNNNQWAASVGGPVIKNKVFFFVNTEGIRYIFGSIHQATAPTPAFQSYVLGNVPQDPATQAFYQNVFKLYNNAPSISHAAPNPGSCSINGLPATIGGDACTESWTDSVSAGNHEWLLSARIDLKLSDSDQIYGRMRFDRGVQPTYTDTLNPIFDTSSNQPQNEGQVNWTHVFSPNVVNNFIASILYYSAIFGSIQANSPALALFPGNLAFSDGSLTNVGFGSGNPGGYGQGFLFPQGRNVTQWGLVDDVSVAKGRHSLKFGVNWRRDDISDFTASEVAVYPAVNVTLAGFANNTVDSFTQYNFAKSGVQPVAFYTFGVYGQDEFRATQNLRFTFTLRADRNSGGVCQHHCAGRPPVPFADLDHGPDVPYNQSYPTGFKSIIPNNEFLVWQPRVGVAWQPHGGKTVIRAGIGLFGDLYPGTILSAVNTNFPQVNLWTVPGGTLAFDGKPLSSTAFPTSGVALVQTCNSVFANNYNNGGSLTTFQAASPACAAVGVPNYAQINPNLSNPKYLQWNIELQHSLGPQAIFSINYVGNHGYDEIYNNPLQNSFGFGSLPATAADPRIAHINYLTDGAKSNYNGLTVSVRSNAYHGLSGSFSYTYSHALDDVSNGGVLPFSVITSVPGQISPAGIGANYASADYDARHQISGSYIYELPFKSSNHLKNMLIGGWQVSGTLFWRAGFPFSAFDGATLGGLVSNNLSPSFNTILLQPTFTRRDFSHVDQCVSVTGSCFGVLAGATTPAINPSAPYQFAPSTNFTGAAVGRNAFRGPGFLGGDMSVRKNFRFTERVTFQLGLNAYNWFNHANYGTPYPNTAASIFGESLITQTPPTSPYGAFAAAATDMRIAQVTGKLTF